jgi:hypothetical protein
MARAREGAAGFIGYYWGRTPALLRASGEQRDAITAGQLERMSELAKTFKGVAPSRRTGDETLEASITDLRLSAAKRAQLRALFETAVREGRYVDFNLKP